MDLTDNYALSALLYVVIAWIISGSVVLLLIYGVVRVAVSRGLRDHHKWMEKNRTEGPVGRRAVDSPFPTITPDSTTTT